MILNSSMGQPLIVHTRSFRNYPGTVKGATWSSTTIPSSIVSPAFLSTSGQPEFILNMNLNVASLTDVLWFMRPGDQTNDLRYQSLGHRTRNLLQRWFFQYGSTTLPQSNGILSMSQNLPSWANSGTIDDKYSSGGRGSTECYKELVKCSRIFNNDSCSRLDFNSYNSDWKFGNLLDPSSNNTSAAPAGITALNVGYGFLPHPSSYLGVGKFGCGLNLELAPGKENLISGLNTNGMNTSIRGIFNPLFLNYMDTVRIDAYAEYDAFINISPGIATTVSF
jgi:hypothetical protein